jgi:hypothetical protein
MTLLPAILALLVAAAGWYYAFYSSAAGKLSGIERPSANRLRVRLRRINGCLMIVLGALFFILASALEQKWRPLTIGWLTLSVQRAGAAAPDRGAGDDRFEPDAAHARKAARCGASAR